MSRSKKSLPGGGRNGSIGASYARYSSDNQDDSSIDQQQRKCRDQAEINRHTIRQEYEFRDDAVSGTRIDREGFQAMLTAAREGLFDVLYIENLSRLAREFVISMPALKELVYVLKVRVISTSENMDTDVNGWEMLATIRCMMHAEFLKNLRIAVLRGQEDAILRDHSVGDWCLGYGSEDIPGSESGRKGHNPRPRKRMIINAEHAFWVRMIFYWFVVERHTIAWIVRELTRLKAPKDHRSSKGEWHHNKVRTVLRNRKYVGIWPWGLKTNNRNPLNGMITQEDRPPEEAAKYERERPDLRLIEDKQFCIAQARLDDFEHEAAKHRGKNGQLAGSGSNKQVRHVLQKLMVCSHCEAPFYVCGANGNYLRCSGSKSGACSHKTQLPRKLATRLILDRVGEILHRNPAWRESVLEYAQQRWTECQRSNPNEVMDLKNQLQSVNAKIEKILDAIENGERSIELQTRLEQRRDEKHTILQRLTKLERESKILDTPPTADWVNSQLLDVNELLKSTPAAANEVLKKLIGCVRLTECSQADRKRKYWQGCFSMDVHSVIDDDEGVAIEVQADSSRQVVTVDFLELPKWASVAEQVKELMDSESGVRQRDIALLLKCPRSWVWKGWRYWHESRGLAVPDARSLRMRLERTEQDRELRDRVMALWNEDMYMLEIAEIVGCCRDTVTAIVNDWHVSQGLPIPDGRTRRKALMRNQEVSNTAGPLNDIA